MSEALLKKLNNQDIDWMISTGKQQSIPAGIKLLNENGSKVIDDFHILLDGSASVFLSQQDCNPLASAFARIENNSKALGFELLRLTRGEIIGENIFTDLKSEALSIQAIEPSVVLTLPLKKLKNKLERDKGFSARFYHTVALVYLKRISLLLDRLGRSNFAKTQPVKDVLYVFDKFHDSDIDWVIAHGELVKISAKTPLIRQGRPIDALYFLLDGQMKILLPSERQNPLTNIFATLEERETEEKEIARLHKGEIFGETPFVDGSLSYTDIVATEDSLVLALPKPLLIAKLQKDIGFSARFYQAISTLLADKLQGIISRLSIGRRTYTKNRTLTEKIRYEDEIDLCTLEQMSLAATKFAWMLQQLRVNH